MAGQHVGAQAQDVGRRGAGQSDGPRGLGGDEKQGSVQGSRYGETGSATRYCESLAMQTGRRTSKGKRSSRRDRENRSLLAELAARFSDLDPIRNVPYRPGGVESAAIDEAG